jgi:hypothetical protein
VWCAQDAELQQCSEQLSGAGSDLSRLRGNNAELQGALRKSSALDKHAAPFSSVCVTCVACA